MDGKFIAYYRVSTDRQGMNGNGMAAQRKAVEDYLNGGRWKLVGEFTEVESGKRAVAGTCMDNRRATVPFSEVKDAVEDGRLKAIWSQRREPLHNTERAHRCLAHRCERRVGRTAPTGVACLESTLPCREGQSPGCGSGRSVPQWRF